MQIVILTSQYFVIIIEYNGELFDSVEYICFLDIFLFRISLKKCTFLLELEIRLTSGKATIWILVQKHNWAVFFENEQGETVKVYGDCYRPMLNEFLFTRN